MNTEDFKKLVLEGHTLSDCELREKILKETDISDWELGRLWEWKQENYKVFGDFLLRAVRSFNGSEDEDLIYAMLGNFHMTIPWYDENNAELCTLLTEEFITKKLARIGKLLAYTWRDFHDHPDFGDDKEKILADLQRFRSSLAKLRFSYLDNL